MKIVPSFPRVALAVLLSICDSYSAPVFLGPLESPNNFNRTSFGPDYIDYANPQQSAPEAFNPNTQEYEVRLPSGYDPAKTYGLICFIDHENGGAAPAVWQPILDKHNLIWMGATNIGNSAWTATRRGATVMGAYRMTQLYSIDPARIFAVGTSGGAQLASELVFMRRDIFKGFIGLAGTSMPTTYNFEDWNIIPGWNPPGRLDNSSTIDDSGIDYGWADWAVPSLHPSLSLFPESYRFAIITNETDFRRTEITGIYRYFYMNLGNRAKLIVRPGAHAVYEGSSFEQAVRYMTAPEATVIRDRFEDASLATNTDAANTLERGSGFHDRSATGATATEVNYTYNSKTQKVLRLTPGSGASAAIVEAKNRFDWTNPDGITIDAKLRAELQAGNNQQIGLHIARGDSDDSPEDNPGLHVFLSYASGVKNRIVFIRADGSQVELAKWDHAGATHPMAMAGTDKLFWYAPRGAEYCAKTLDFRGEDLRIVASDDGFQLTFARPAANLETNFPGKVILAASPATLTSGPNVGTSDGEDHRIVLQGRWGDLNLASAVKDLTFRHWKLLLSNRSINPAAAAGNALVDEITLLANSEELNFIPPTISTPGHVTVNATNNQGAIVNFSPTATAASGASLAVTSIPASGSGFPIGTTAVTCTATDLHGNTATATFQVTVQTNGFTAVPPSPPVAASPTAAFGSVTLSWSAVPYATSYTIRRATSSNGTYAVIASAITALTFTDSGLANGIPLFYKITANNPTGESPPSAIVTATPVPGTAAKANNSLDLDLLNSWTTPSVPGHADIALWDATVTDANTTTIGAGVSFSGIRITNPLGDVTIQPGTGGNLTLGSQGIDMSATSPNLNISANTSLTSAQTWHTGASTITATGILTGSAALAKSGPGILSLSGNNSNYSGEITLKEGTLRYGGATGVSAFGSGRIYLGEANGLPSATLDFGITTSTTVTNPITVNSGSGGRIIRSNMSNMSGQTISGALTGEGNLTFASGTTTFTGASAATFTGNILVAGGRLRLANGSTFSNSSILSIGSGATVDLNASGSTWNFAGLSDISSAGGILTNAGSNRSINLRGSGSYVFSGNVRGLVRLIVNLSGTGSQTLGGTDCNYSGSTTVTAGTLIVNGALTNAAAATVATAGRLAGSGSIAANTTINGTLAPGDGPGTLTISGTLAMNATSKLQWELPTNTTTGGDFLNAAAVTVTSGAKLDLSLNAPGSTVSFTDPFWQSDRSWPVLSSTALTGTLALGTTSPDSAGRSTAGYGVFSITHSATSATIQWTAYSERQRWNFLHFATLENTGNAADGADPDNDGINNLAEYNAGTNPNDSTSLPPYIWTSTSSGQWSNAANWNQGSVPSSNPATKLEFLTGQSPGNISIAAANDIPATFQLNQLTLAGVNPTAATQVDLSGGALRFVANGSNLPMITLAASSSAFSYTVANALTLDATTTFSATNSGKFLFTGPITGPGGITRTGASSALILSADSSYQGTTTISEGILQIGNDGLTGTPGTGPIVNNGILRIDRSGTLDLKNSISGAGSLLIDNPAAADTVILSAQNSHSGGIILNKGTLRLTHTNALGTGTKTLSSPGADRRIQLSNNITLPADLTISASSNSFDGGGINNLDGNNEIQGPIRITTGNGLLNISSTAGTLLISGNITAATATRSLLLGGASSSANTISGAISDGSTAALPVTKQGAGTWALTKSHTYTGPTAVNAGKLILSGSLTSDVTATTTGTLAPQGSPATTKALNITSTGRLEVRPGDTLTVASTVTLAGHLDIIAPPGLAPGTSYTILNKTSPESVSGSFTGKPEGSTFTASGYEWQITYTGGNGGNDTIITIPLPTALSALETWRQTHFGTTQNTGNAADSFDSNNDGESNLLEFATGQSPHTNSRAATIITFSTGANMEFTYTRSKEAFDAGYLYQVEHSDTLAPGSWLSAGLGTVIIDGPSQTVRAIIPQGNNARRFVRLRVNAP
jgi:autotransporter-associated beta strand protein